MIRCQCNVLGEWQCWQKQSHCHKCFLCKKLLFAGDVFSSIQDYLPDEYKQLFKNVNCEGLSQPFKFTYTVTALAV